MLRSLVLLFALLTAAPALGGPFPAVPGAGAGAGTCAGAWPVIDLNMPPIVGLTTSNTIVIALVPTTASQWRVRIDSTYGQTRPGLGGQAIEGDAGSRAAERTGSWDSMKGTFSTTGAAGVALAANQQGEFKFSGLASDTAYQYHVEVQCGDGSWRSHPVFSGGRAKTLVAAREDKPVSILLSTDTHLMQHYCQMVSEASATASIDGDSDGVPDNQENFLRGIETIRHMAVQAPNADMWIAMGDDTYQHTCQPCALASVSWFGPCTSHGTIDEWAGRGRVASLGFDYTWTDGNQIGLGQWEVGRYGAGIGTGTYDDTVSMAEGRVGLFVHHAWPIMRNTMGILHPGNHEAWNSFGRMDCTASRFSSSGVGGGVHQRCTNTPAGDAWHPDSASRESYRNYLPNPNEYWPTGVSAGDNTEQGAFWAIETGHLLIIALNEYIFTDGTEAVGYLWPKDTSAPVACGLFEPWATCRTYDYNDTEPSTPWEWKMGAGQEVWFQDLIANTEAETIFVFSHHAFGGVGAADGLYDYGRLPHATLRRECKDLNGDPILMDSATMSGWLPGNIPDGTPLPCWSGAVSQTSHLDKDAEICDYMDDGVANDSANCGPLIPGTNADLYGIEGTVIDPALQNACQNGKTVIRGIGHDHLMTFHQRGCVYWWTLGQAGGNVVTSWAGQTGYMELSDMDGDGIPDYRQSPIVKSLAGGQPTQNPPPPAWDGKGYGMLTVGPEGGATVEFWSSPGWEADPSLGEKGEDGYQVMDVHLAPTREVNP